jgi:hypothetical protein
MRHVSMGRRAMGRTGLILAVIGLLLASMAPSAQAADSERNPVDFAFSALAAEWWEWALEQPAATNPLADPTGEDCGNEQRGPVWFLAGPWNLPSPVVRTCTVPRGKLLFFPLLNVFSGSTPDDPLDQRTVAFQRDAVANSGIKQAINLSVTVDGRRVFGIVRYEESKVFRVVLPDGSLITNYPGGTEVYPTVDAGYYALLAPLSPGNHTLRFTGAFPGEGAFAVDVTYNLTVSRR